MLCLRLACVFTFVIFFFKQKTAYEMRISDWSSDVCSSDLKGVIGLPAPRHIDGDFAADRLDGGAAAFERFADNDDDHVHNGAVGQVEQPQEDRCKTVTIAIAAGHRWLLGGKAEQGENGRSEEHTSELQ